MLLGQIGISFLAWIVFAISLWRGYYRRRSNQAPRAWRIARGVVVMVLSVVVLFFGILQLQSMGGIKDGSLTLLGWAFATLLGAIFVAMQVDAVDALLSIVFENVTQERVPASDIQEGKKEV